MQAIVIKKTGGLDVLELMQDYPLPEQKTGQVLVKVCSSSVNPVEASGRAGHVPFSLPRILGGDLAGVVAAADEGSAFKQGDRVAALTPGFRPKPSDPQGTYAQYVAVDEAHLAKLPASVPLETAGGLPLVGLTAWQSLMAAKPVAGQRVLVFAASGGVGHVAVQLAKALGLYAVGVTGNKNTAWVLECLGADEVVDYTCQDFADLYSATDKQFDIVWDVLSNTPERTVKILSVLKPGGHYSHIRNSAGPSAGSDMLGLQQLQAAHEAGRSPSVSITVVAPNGKQLEHLFALWEAGQLKLEVAQVFPLADIAAAHQQVETGHTRGKIVLSIPQ